MYWPCDLVCQHGNYGLETRHLQSQRVYVRDVLQRRSCGDGSDDADDPRPIKQHVEQVLPAKRVRHPHLQILNHRLLHDLESTS